MTKITVTARMPVGEVVAVAAETATVPKGGTTVLGTVQAAAVVSDGGGGDDGGGGGGGCDS